MDTLDDPSYAKMMDDFRLSGDVAPPAAGLDELTQ